MTDDRYRWVIVGYTLVIQAVTVGTLIYCFALFAVPWIDEFADSRAEVMLAVSLLQIVFGLLGPIAGSAMDRLRMRTIVLIGVACYATGYALLTQVTALWQLYLLFATLFPIAMSLMGTLASQTLVTRWFTSERGLAIGVSAMGTSIGGMAFPLLVAVWLVSIGWRDTAGWLALIGLVLVAPLTWLILARRSPAVAVEAGSDAASLSARAVLSSRAFWITIAGVLPLNLVFGGVQFNLGAYAADLDRASFAGELIAISAAAMVAGKLLFGALADRIRHRVLFWIAASFMIIAMLLLHGSPDDVVLVLGVTFVGLAGGGILPIMAVIVGARFPVAHFGRVMGLVMLSLTVASLGPIVAGRVFDLTGSYDPAFVLFAALLVPGMIAMIWLPPPRSPT